jgi:hypothetical protein
VTLEPNSWPDVVVALVVAVALLLWFAGPRPTRRGPRDDSRW